jgi:hypothetical protein
MQAQLSTPWHPFNYRQLLQEGGAEFTPQGSRLLITLRGNCMLDVFSCHDSSPVAYLDFDLEGPITVSSVIKSPLVGLPSTNTVRHRYPRLSAKINQLRQCHHYGFYISPEYRNKGLHQIWNLDELLMAVIIEMAFDRQIALITIKPSDERSRYYRRKFSAVAHPTADSSNILSITPSLARARIPHIRLVSQDGRTHSFYVKSVPDPM